jgi:signal transduction histidine kinase
VAELVRRLEERAEGESQARRALAASVGALLDAPASGSDGFPVLVEALVGASRQVDAAGILLREGAGFRVLAAVGLEVGDRFAPRPGRGLLAQAVRTREPAFAAGAPPPFPPGTRAAAAVPILSRGEVAGVALAGTRSEHELAPEDLLLVRLLAERAGRAVERETLVDALGGAEAIARRTGAFRDQILGIVGHDLRNPLGAVLMAASLLAKRGELPGWQARAVARIRSSGARMERIISDLLSYTRTRLGDGIPILRQPADLGELARKIVDELAVLHPECRIALAAEDDLAGEWDPARLEQVLSNLVSNALDHGEPECTVEVRASGAGDGVRLEVVNRGEVPEHVLEHAFEPFRRAPDRESRKASGLGLGLYIAQQIVLAHGGEIGIRAAGGDTRVTVTLPRRPAAAPAPAAEPRADAGE